MSTDTSSLDIATLSLFLTKGRQHVILGPYVKWFSRESTE